jgi:hypothetical protein
VGGVIVVVHTICGMHGENRPRAGSHVEIAWTV